VYSSLTSLLLLTLPVVLGYAIYLAFTRRRAPNPDFLAAVHSAHHARLAALREKPLSELEQLPPLNNETITIHGKQIWFRVWQFRQPDRSLMIVIAAGSGRIVQGVYDYLGLVVSPSGEVRDTSESEIDDFVLTM